MDEREREKREKGQLTVFKLFNHETNGRMKLVCLIPEREEEEEEEERERERDDG